MENNQISIQQLDEDDAEHIMYLESRCFGLITEPNSLYFRITPAILYMHSGVDPCF